MERKIGEIFEYKGKKIKTIEGSNCRDCYFNKIFIGRCEIPDCLSSEREDKTEVIFKEIKE